MAEMATTAPQSPMPRRARQVEPSLSKGPVGRVELPSFGCFSGLMAALTPRSASRDTWREQVSSSK